MISMKRKRIQQNNDKYEEKENENSIEQWKIWNEREFHKIMINMNNKRISFILTSAPCSTKNWTISIDLLLMAILRGLSLISREPNKTMLYMKKKRIQ